MKPLIIILLFILIILSQINTIMDQDIWLHLKSGQYIFKNLSVPRVDIFSYTVSGRPWIDHEWLTQVIFYITHKFFGFNGLIVLKATVVFLIFFLILKLCYKKTNFFILILFLIASVLTFSYRSLVRPELFSYFFFTCYIYILENYRKKEKDLLLLLPFLQMLWTNIHGYFILGIILCLIYLLQEFIKRDSEAVGIFVLILLSTLINPNFLKGSVYPLQILIRIFSADSIFKETIVELKMPATLSFSKFLFFWILIIMTLFTFIANIKKREFFYLMVFLFGFILSYSSLRDIPYLAILATPIAVNNLKEIKFIENQWTNLFSIFLITLSISPFVTNYFYKSESDFRRSGFGVSEPPKSVADFIKATDLKGNLFNSFLFGGYLVYRFFPERKIFVDNRTELYGPQIYRLYQDAHCYPSVWERVVSKYNINFCILQHIFGGLEALIERLYKEKGWALIYFDEYSAIFIKEVPENSKVIENYRVDLNKIKNEVQYKDLRIARFFEILEEWDAAETVYNNILRQHKDSYKAKNGLGVLYLRKGKLDEAYKIFTELLVHYKSSPEVYHNLGLTMLKSGKRAEAIKCFERALKIDPKFRYPYYTIGQLNFEEGFFQTAKRFFERYLVFDPYNSKAHYYLGTIELGLRNFNKAISELKEATLLSPQDYFSHNNLGIVYAALNRKTEAEAEWRRALEISPDFEPARENLRRLEQSKK